MDFEHAAQRLKREQSKLKGRRGRPELPAKAKREAERRKKQQERLAAERQRKKRQEEFVSQYFQQCEVSMGVKQISRGGNLKLSATSIHGEGDKIALPPSALEYLTSSGNDLAAGSPWIFRIGILNPEYSFPASPTLQNMQPPDDDMDDYDDEDDDDEEGDDLTKKAYLDELDHRYLSYTHGTVVEFTQEEDHIGLPQPIAAALLAGNKSGVSIPTTRTVDPASTVQMTDGDTEGDKSNAMDVDGGDDDEEKTPGHLAWGAFDVPDLPIEVVLVQIPKGKACRLTPTPDAIRNGFYNLKDVKMVLEQSLIRTRATLSVGDLVHTWHRGVKFDLSVTEVNPSIYNTVTCINTDIEVEFGHAEMPDDVPVSESERADKPAVHTGYTLGSSSSAPSTSTSMPTSSMASTSALKVDDLLQEPPTEQTEGVCTVQIRSGAGGQERRRFDVRKAKVGDLFAFATKVAGVPSDRSSFQLVTRFPRRAFLADAEDSTMEQAGIGSGQELFMVEML